MPTPKPSPKPQPERTVITVRIPKKPGKPN
jgi:hypothetical protein